VRFLRRALWILGALAVLYLYFSTLHPHERAQDHAFFDGAGVWAIAHRGGRGLWPENTLFALENAKALGADVLEMDLRATADGVIVLMHDRTVERTTDGTGRVDGMTFAELGRLDAGYRFRDASGRLAYRGRGIAVPALDEVLTQLGDVRLNVELKDASPEFAVRLCDLLQARGATQRVLVASFDHDAMTAFRRACPAVATSATLREALTLYQLDRVKLTSLYRGPAAALQIPEMLRGRRIVDPELLELAEKMNLRVHVWTVNDEAGMRRLLDLGVQGILTDYPDLLLKLMGRLRTEAH
jgi:glycerophosphoryl diester phosphodiesterase